MLFKDSLLLTFFLDREDPVAAEDADELWTACCGALQRSGTGRCDDRQFNERGGFAEWSFAGHDADALLAQIRNLVVSAACVIGPRASLISRRRGSSQASIRHVDL